jgi:hypothetical protein
MVHAWERCENTYEILVGNPERERPHEAYALMSVILKRIYWM